MEDRRPENPPSLLRSLWESLVDDQKEGLRIARWGAVVGALLGAIIGGLGLWLMYQLA